MTARVLVVDDVPANVKLLEARLSAEYFDVVTASGGEEALAICERAECDLVLLDVMMPDMDGFEVCRRLKCNPQTHHIPVVMVTALDQPSDRVRGLEAGADDFLTKPVSDVALIARVRSLARLKLMTDELRMRAVTSRDIGLENPERDAVTEAGRNGAILIVDDRPASAARLAEMLAGEHRVDIEADPNEALFHAAEGNYDLMIVSLSLANFDGLRLCSQIRSLERTRNVAILAVADAENNTRLVRGLEIGVNDARQAADGADPRHRLLQGDQRRLGPRCRRRRAARIRAAHPQVDPRHRSGLPLRRRGIRRGHAGNRHGGRNRGGRAAATADRDRGIPDPAGRAQDRCHHLGWYRGARAGG